MLTRPADCDASREVQFRAVPPGFADLSAEPVQVPDDAGFGASPGEILVRISAQSGPGWLKLHSVSSVTERDTVVHFCLSPFLITYSCYHWVETKLTWSGSGLTQTARNCNIVHFLEW